MEITSLLNLTIQICKMIIARVITICSLIIIICIAPLVSDYRNTDLKNCKLTHLGLEYSGEEDETEGGIRCQSWSSSTPIHKIDSSIKDEMFPEKSKRKARNYCRNPTKRELGPWCYTMDPELSDDYCAVPLCAFPDCRLTGPGMEYSGQHNKAASDKKCLKWDKDRKKVVDKYGDLVEQEKFSKRTFPDESRADAENYCRNPDGDPGGPWCFVDVGKGAVEKQYCDIPSCDVEDCITFTKNFSTFSHYTFLNKSVLNITFGIKKWHPDDLEPSAKLLLSLFALPLTGEEIDELNIGIGIYISNKHAAMTIGNKDQPDYEPTGDVIKSSLFTFFSLVWDNGFVTLTMNSETQPIFLSEYRWKKGIFGVNRNKFFHYSIQGTNVLWSLPFCVVEDVCEVHTTTSNNFERYWPLRHTNTSHDLKFYIRSFHSASILFQPSPSANFPRVIVILSDHKHNLTRVTLYEHAKASGTVLKTVTILKLLSYWEWKQFTITVFGDTLQVYWDRDVGTQLVIEAKNDKIAGMRWFSPGTDNSVALWTFFCPPGENDAPPPPWPPECVVNVNEAGYVGTQSVTHSGHPCLPWTHDSETESHVGEKDTLKLWNYCRDPLKQRKGTYCFAVNQKSETKFVKEKCHLELCRSSECRMAGTGNDYIGKLNTTRSNRTCQQWNVNFPHKVNKTYFNESLYADKNLTVLENYCRNPSRNIAGSWCYTTDKEVPRDVCNIRDCVHAEECIMMTKGSGQGRHIYILPDWKEGGIQGGLYFALKEWNPDHLDGIIFELTPLDDKPGFLKLVIGAEHNERVLVYYSDTDKKNAKLVKEKTLPHLIPVGSWAAFWLQMRKGEIMLGYQGNSEPLFIWEHDNKDKAFEPGFFTYFSIHGNLIGVHFKCTECHTEKTSSTFVTRVMPLQLWSTVEANNYTSLSIYARGTGILLIPLLLLPGEGLDYYAFTIGDGDGTYLLFILNLDKTTKKLGLTRRRNLLDPVRWTHYFFTFSEHDIEVFRDNKSILKVHNNETMLFYWFTVTVEKGWITWSANCEPPDIDGPPRDGGWSEWSPWQCTVTCGGGTGIRHRTCTNPRPNIRGKICHGSYTDTGKCNEFECGDLIPDTLEKIRNRLKNKHHSLIVNEGENVTIEHDKDILDLVEKESPKASYEWTYNGIYLKAKVGDFEFVDNGILINSAIRSKHSGVYICVLYRVGGQKLILKVISLAVISNKPDISIRATLDMKLVCNSAVLGYVYMDLSQAWLLNDTEFVDYGITSLAAVVSEKIRHVNFTHAGNWTCTVTQSDLKFQWVIDIIQVEVKGPPTWITHLMEDQFTKPIFGRLNEKNVALVFYIIIIVVIALVALGLIVYLVFGRLPKTKYTKLETNTEN